MAPARLALLCLMLLALAAGSHGRQPRALDADRATAPAPGRANAADSVLALRDAACSSVALRELASRSGAALCADAANTPFVPALARVGGDAVQRVASPGDGLLVNRARILTVGGIALDLVAYLSSGLVVGGLFCYTDDGQPRSTILHLSSGIGGIFLNQNPPGSDTIYSCYSWAAEHGRNVFVPSYRGQDGGQGEPELCLGEADDVANAATLLRGLDVVDPNRLALIGGSLGGCVALKAGVKIPNLRAVVSIVPPTDWAAMIALHRSNFAPAQETRCDGTVLPWNSGGPALADMLDRVICGHPGCPTDAYQVRSPIPQANESTNPTLVAVAGADNLVQPSQQLIWSGLRNDATGAVSVDVRHRCSEPAAPAFAQDVLLYVPGAFHLMEEGPVASSLLWMFERLDEASPPASAGL